MRFRHTKEKKIQKQNSKDFNRLFSFLYFSAAAAAAQRKRIYLMVLLLFELILF